MHYSTVDAIAEGTGTDAEKIAALNAYDILDGWRAAPKEDVWLEE